MGKSLGSSKMTHLARLVDSTKAQVIFISEIKSSKVKSAELNARFNMFDSFVVPSRRLSGGLWLMCNDDLHITVHTATFYLILATATIRSSNQKLGLVLFMAIRITVKLVPSGIRSLILCMIMKTCLCYVWVT